MNGMRRTVVPRARSRISKKKGGGGGGGGGGPKGVLMDLATMRSQ